VLLEIHDVGENGAASLALPLVIEPAHVGDRREVAVRDFAAEFLGDFLKFLINFS
jgi:hypothetical protein